MLSFAELSRAEAIIQKRLLGQRVQRWVQPGAESVVLSLYGRPLDADEKARKSFLLLCCRPGVARISEAEALPRAPRNPPAFVSWLRAHLDAARLASVRILGEDRILALGFESGAERFELVLALLGSRSNLYVLDHAGRIVVALRPPAQTRPELLAGVLFAPPASGRPGQAGDRFAAHADAEFLAAIEAHYLDVEGDRSAQVLVREIRQVLKRETRNATRRLEKIEAELAEADLAGDLQRWGELLKGSLSRVERGPSEVTLRDYETGEDVRIPLDSSKSPKANLEATFQRYQKLLRRLSKAGGKVDQARRGCERVVALAQELESAAPADGDADSERLAALAEEPELARLLARHRRARSPRAAASDPADRVPSRFRDLPRKLHPRRYRSLDGLEIWVGRSDEGNDKLTTRLARGNDLFFHLDGAPGSHVVLRTEGLADPPQESLLDACELAVHFSKQKAAGHADVHIVPIKQVKKPRGAKPGLVWVTGGRSLHLRREEKRLERLLAARIEP